MQRNEKFAELADEEMIQQAVAALEANGIKAQVVQTGKEARDKVLEIVPKGAEVMTMTSMTLEALGIPKEINESGAYISVRNKLNSMNRETEGRQMQQLGASPDWALGSVHALTQDGEIVIASATGSQLPAYAYGSSHVLWVVGAQKIVKDMDEAVERIYDYVYALEDERAMAAYGMHSGVNKKLVISREVTPGRIQLIIVKEKLGF